MKLTKCNECDHEISLTATHCPKCGNTELDHIVYKKTVRTLHYFYNIRAVWALTILIIFAYFFYLVHQCGDINKIDILNIHCFNTRSVIKVNNLLLIGEIIIPFYLVLKIIEIKLAIQYPVGIVIKHAKKEELNAVFNTFFDEVNSKYDEKKIIETLEKWTSRQSINLMRDLAVIIIINQFVYAAYRYFNMDQIEMIANNYNWLNHYSMGLFGFAAILLLAWGIIRLFYEVYVTFFKK